MSILGAPFERGVATANRAEAGATSGLMNRQAQAELRRNEQARASNEDLAYLSDSRTGIYTIGDNEGDDNVQYTLRADWKDQVDKYHSGGDSKLRFNKLASNYLSKNADGEVVKKRSKKTFGPTKTKAGTVPTALTDKLAAKPNDEALLALKAQYEKGEKTAYIVPVENQEGMFSFITRFGTDQPDDEELIFSENEVEAYLGTNLISGLQLEIDPDARRQASAAAQGAYDNTDGYDQMNVSMERAKALYDDEVPRTTKLGILQQITDEYNKNPKVKEQPPIVTEKEVTTSTPGADIDEKDFQAFKRKVSMGMARGGNAATMPNDDALRDSYRKSKGLTTSSTTTETLKTETAVDPIEVKFNEAFPGLENLSETELQGKVSDFVNDGTFTNNGFTPDQVQSVRTNLESMNVESMDDLKAKVEDGTVKNPYKYALTLNLALANDKGEVNGQDIKTATDRTFNYLVAGDPNRTAKEQISDDISIAQEQRLGKTFDFNVSKYWNTKSASARQAFGTRVNDILKRVPKLESKFLDAMAFIRESFNDGDKTKTFEQYSSYDRLGKTIMKDYANQFKATDESGESIYSLTKKDFVEKYGFAEDSFNDEMFFRMAQPVGGSDLIEGRAEVALYNGYQQLVESNLAGALWPGGKITMKDFLGDFMDPNTPFNPTQFMKQKMAIRTDSNGKPIELVIRTNNPKYASQNTGDSEAGRVEEGEASIRFDYLIKNNILPAEHIIAIIENAKQIR